MKVKLHRGVEAGFVCSLKSNEILLMGGETNEGQLDSVISINLVEKTYQFNSRMKCARSLQKAIKYKDQIFVFGGSEVDTF